MRKLTIAALISILFCAVWVTVSNAREVSDMTDKLIRIHVIANSDSAEDQELKLKVRDGILEAVAEAVDGVADKQEAMVRIFEKLAEIENRAEKIILENGADCGVSATLKKEEFGERRYDDFTLPAGTYDSLCVRIGEAKGHNWWCVCYPSLCVGSAVSVDECGVFTEGELKIIREPDKVRYKLWCFEMLKKLKNFF